MICIPRKQIEKIKQAIRTGKITPEKLMEMTSQERRMFFEQIIGKEYAKDINLLFEKKLLLKNQERAVYNWAREIMGLSKTEKKAILNKIRETYAEKRRRVYNPKENEMFLDEIVSDVYSKKFNRDVSLQEAEIITDLSRDLVTAKEKLGDLTRWMTEDFVLKTSKKDALDFGASKVAMDNYLGNLKKLATQREWLNLTMAKSIKEAGEAIINNAMVSFNFIAENSRAIVASVDNSLWGRQGLSVLFRRPDVWAKDFAKSWRDIYQVFKGGNKSGDDIMNGVKTEIYSRENYMKGRYTPTGERKLDIGIREEEFPTSAPSRIPALGRFFRAAEVAYEVGAMRLRVDVADKFYSMAERTEVDMTNKFEIGSINEMINSMTGRGRMPLGEATQAGINKVFFSVKFFKSNFDKLTLHAGSKMSSSARKQAGINLLYLIAGIAIILAIAKKLDPDSVTFDPTNANFGKIKIGNVRFDVTGGMSSLVILASRLIFQKTTSSITGTVTKLGEGFGTPTGMDMFWNFMENKFSPMFSVIKEIVKQRTFEGSRPTVLAEIQNLTVPIIIEEGMTAAKSEGFATIMLALIAEAIGISANAYIYNVDWNFNPGKELQQFKIKIGDIKFKEANQKYNDEINKGLLDLQRSEKWPKMDNEEKKVEITKMKDKAKNKIFQEYNFEYIKKKK